MPVPSKILIRFRHARVAHHARVVLLALIVSGFIALPGCKKHTQQSPATRTYRMGFMSNAPRPDINLYLQSLSLWPAHSDATIISVEVPWDSLLNGVNPINFVQNNYLYLVSICRQKGLKLWLYIDPENGLNRTSDANELIARGKSIAGANMQQLYRRFVVVADSIIRPDHLGVALETNLIRAAAPDSIYQGVKKAANAAASDVRAIDGKVLLSVSIQAEVAWGKLGGLGYVGVSQDFADFPFLQELGISSYPYLGWNNPADLPDNYYSELTASHPLPVFISEGGWSSMPVGNGLTGGITQSTPAGQAAYIQRQGQLLTKANGSALFQLTYTDLDVAAWPAIDTAGLAPFAWIGVVDTNFAAKPALRTWDSLFHLPLQAGR